jgi:hypothetical protein
MWLLDDLIELTHNSGENGNNQKTVTDRVFGWNPGISAILNKTTVDEKVEGIIGGAVEGKLTGIEDRGKELGENIKKGKFTPYDFFNNEKEIYKGNFLRHVSNYRNIFKDNHGGKETFGASFKEFVDTVGDLDPKDEYYTGLIGGIVGNIIYNLTRNKNPPPNPWHDVPSTKKQNDLNDLNETTTTPYTRKRKRRYHGKLFF